MRQPMTIITLLGMVCLIYVTTQFPLEQFIVSNDSREPASTKSVPLPKLGSSYIALFSTPPPNPALTSGMEAHGDCETCGKKKLADQIAEIVEPASTITCPSHIQAAKRLMALSYQNCDALSLYPFSGHLWGENDEPLPREEFHFAIPQGCERRFNCTAMNPDTICHNCDNMSGNENCRGSLYNEDPNCGNDQSHWYNSLPKTCKIDEKCDRVAVDNTGDEPKPLIVDGKCQVTQHECTSMFYMLYPESGRPQGLTQDVANTCDGQIPSTRRDPFPYMNVNSRNEINPFAVLNRDELGNQFVGWSCSEFISSALALSGLRLEKGEDVARPLSADFQGYNVDLHLNDLGTSSKGCFDVVRLDDPGESLRSGDLILFAGHSMMVDSAAEDYMGVDPKTASSMDDCNQDKIKTKDLNFNTIHAFSTPGGLGAGRTRMADYQRMVFKGQFQNIKNFTETAYNKEIQNETDSERRQLLTNRKTANLSLIDRMIRNSNEYLDADGDDLNSETREDYNEFESFIETDEIAGGDAKELLNDMMWVNLRRHFSAICKVQFCNHKPDLCDQAEKETALAVLNQDKPVITVTRHEANKYPNDPERGREEAAANGCIDPNPPTLAYPECHGKCEERIRTCPATAN